MKVIITTSFCCDNLWKSKFMALEKPGILRGFFPPTYMVATVRKSQGKWNFKSIAFQKSQSIQTNKNDLQLIIHIRYSVHAIHTPLQSKTI